MDILDNIIYANLNCPLIGGNLITSDFIPPFVAAVPAPITPPGNPAPVFEYSAGDKMSYCSYEDPTVLERSIQRHWQDINMRMQYTPGGPAPMNPIIPAAFSNFRLSSTYHLIMAYMLENTRILQIFERVIEKSLHDEELGITNNPAVFNWFVNSEKLFFKNDYPRAINIRSLIRPSSDSSRRNAYMRMFGMDLAFGDINSTSGGVVEYAKAKASNTSFVALFEKYIIELWQGYTNARNANGPNTTDVNNLVQVALQLRELLQARRGGDPSQVPYGNLNLSREEFSSIFLTTWFSFVVSYDSPVVNFLSCQSTTIGERLMKIGTKVGVPAHKKCQSLFEMAGAIAIILTSIETGGFLTNEVWVQGMLTSLNPGNPPSVQGNYMNYFLTVINNWEKATGHPIKNPEANVRGVVSVSQNGRMVPSSNGVRKPELV